MRSGRPETVLLVAKPWRGGLGEYLRLALEALFPGRVEWIRTYPGTRAERARYRRDRRAWRQEIVRRLEGGRYRAVLFVNPPPELSDLPERANHVLWLTDDPRGPGETFAPYARVFVCDPGYAPAAARVLGARFAGTVALAHSRVIHAGAGGRGSGEGACMIANRDPKRDRHLAAVLESGLRPRVVGNYFGRHRLFWRHPGCFRPAVANEAMGAVYARYAVSLNVHAEVVRGGTNMRTFECAGYGIAQVVEHRPGLESLFEPGRDIAVYHDPGEAAEVLASVLADPARRARMSAYAALRARAEHSYEHRIAHLLRDVLDDPALRRWR